MGCFKVFFALLKKKKPYGFFKGRFLGFFQISSILFPRWRIFFFFSLPPFWGFFCFKNWFFWGLFSKAPGFPIGRLKDFLKKAFFFHFFFFFSWLKKMGKKTFQPNRWTGEFFCSLEGWPLVRGRGAFLVGACYLGGKLLIFQKKGKNMDGGGEKGHHQFFFPRSFSFSEPLIF